MTGPSIRHRIDEQLDRLPPELQHQVLDFVQALVISRPKGTSGAALARFAGALSADDVASMGEAIEAGCERVDVDGW